MAFTYNNKKPKRIHLIWEEKGIDVDIKKFNVDYGSVKNIWSSGNAVTYYVDLESSIYYVEDVNSGNSCLSPTTFTPMKSGWTFVGWREDKIASSSVLTNKVMGNDPITLYAVFEQNVTATFISYSNTQYTYGNRYYNNGNTENASVSVPDGASYSGWDWRGWANAGITSADADANNESIYTGLTGNVTYYGLYQQTITLSYMEQEMVYGAKTGTRYYNAAGNYKNPTFSLSLGALSGWTAIGWAKNSGSATAAKAYDPTISGLELDANLYLYGLYQQTITLSYNGNGATGGSVSAQTGIRKYNSFNTYSNPTFTLAANGFTRTNYEFTGWDLGAVEASVTLETSQTAYAQWKVLAIPYTVDMSSYPMTMTASGNDDDTAGVYNYSTSYVIEVAKDENTTAYGYVSASVTYPTQNCNKVRVKYSHTGSVPEINGVYGESASYTDHYAYLNCTGDSFTLGVYLVAADTNKQQTTIKEVYFYYE